MTGKMEITNQDVELIITALQYFEVGIESKKAKQDVISLKYRLLGYDDVSRHAPDLAEISAAISAGREAKVSPRSIMLRYKPTGNVHACLIERSSVAPDLLDVTIFNGQGRHYASFEAIAQDWEIVHAS